MNKDVKLKYWTEFIELYRSKPVLWKLDSNKYKNRNLKKEAYKVLATKLREIEPTADINMVKRKLSSLRACYRREITKIGKLRKTGIRGYSPKWAYFDLFAFIGEQRDSLCDEKHEQEDDDQTEETETEEEIEYFSPIPSPPPASKQKRLFENQVSYTPIARNAFRKQYAQNYDDSDILSIGWAVQYRDLSIKQKLFAKKAIDDILFEAKLETLHRHSVKINENICSNCMGQ